MITFEGFIDHVLEVMQHVSYKDWRIAVRMDGDRVYLQCMFTAPRAETGEPHDVHGRKWFLSRFMCDSEIVSTALMACLAAEEHECRESFRYRGQRIFGPHLDVDAMADALANGSMTTAVRGLARTTEAAE